MIFSHKIKEYLVSHLDSTVHQIMAKAYLSRQHKHENNWLRKHKNKSFQS